MGDVEMKAGGPPVPHNHQQRLEHIVRRAAVRDKVRGCDTPRALLPHLLPYHLMQFPTGNVLSPSLLVFFFFFFVVSVNRSAVK